MNVFPDNTLTHFKTQLAVPLHLEGSWVCGLSEIFFPRTWPNITEESQITIRGKHTLDLDALAEDIVFTFGLPTGYYQTEQDLVGTLNDNIGRYFQDKDEPHVKFDFMKRAQRIQVKIKHDASVTLQGPVATILGFQPDQEIVESMVAPRGFDPAAGMNAIYIYSNLIQPQLVGDVHVPLLRIVPVLRDSGSLMYHQYDKPHYHALSCKSFQVVEIDIRDDKGRPVSFERGHVVVTLHFKRQDEGTLLL